MEAGNMGILDDLLNLPGIKSMVSKLAVSGDPKKIRSGLLKLKNLIGLLKDLGVDKTIIESVIKQLAILAENERYIEKGKEIKDEVYKRETQVIKEILANFAKEAKLSSEKIHLEHQEQVRVLEAAAIKLQKEQFRIAAQIQEANSRIIIRSERIGQIETRIQQNTFEIKEAGKELIESGYVEKLREFCPSIPKQIAEDKFNACWDDSKIKSGKEYNLVLAKALGISVEQVEKVNAESTVFKNKDEIRESRLKDNEKLETERQALKTENKIDLEHVEELKSQFETNQTFQKDLLQTVATLTGQPIESVTAKVNEDALEKFVEEAPNKADEVEKKLAEVEKTLSADQKEFEEADIKIKQVDREIKEKEGEIELADEDEKPKLEEQKALKEKELEVLDKRKDELRPKIAQNKIALDELTSEIKLLRSKPAEIKEQLQEAERQVANIVSPKPTKVSESVKDPVDPVTQTEPKKILHKAQQWMIKREKLEQVKKEEIKEQNRDGSSMRP